MDCRSTRHAWLILPWLAVFLLDTVPAAGAAPPTTTCQVFPADNVWNADISTLPVHARSAQWLASTAAASTNLHPDFGGPPYGFPYNVVDNTHPIYSVTFLYASESDPGPYPVGVDTSFENGSDRHALIINRDTCTLYELYNVSGSGSSWSAGSGAIFALGSNALRPSGWTSADAAGVSPFPPGVPRGGGAGGGPQPPPPVPGAATAPGALFPPPPPPASRPHPPAPP